MCIFIKVSIILYVYVSIASVHAAWKKKVEPELYSHNEKIEPLVGCGDIPELSLPQQTNAVLRLGLMATSKDGLGSLHRRFCTVFQKRRPGSPIGGFRTSATFLDRRSVGHHEQVEHLEFFSEAHKKFAQFQLR